MIHIDGSMGEGGGQIVRSALALSMITGRPFRIDNIRAGRPKPGLMRQHLTAVKAARRVCGGGLVGAELGATEFEFAPGPVVPGAFEFAIGTAGSTTLVLQTVLPALMIASEPSEITLIGGTHNTHAPSVHFLRRAFLPVLERMGPRVLVELERHGFYPAGGGRIRVRIEPVGKLKPIEIMERGEVTSRLAIATTAGLPESIATRELASLRASLGWPDESLHAQRLDANVGPGNVVSVELISRFVTEVFTGFGERGRPAEQVANDTANDVRAYLASGAPVWRHLADQLMLPMAIAGGGAFRTGRLTPHAITNAEVIERFLPVNVHREREVDGNVTVRMQPRD